MCKEFKISVEIVDTFFDIAHYSYLNEYTLAQDRYLELAIGNAPWPSGVTNVGIHERAGRTRI